MNTEPAFCGLMCYTCPIHLAGAEQNPEKRLQMQQAVSEQMGSMYHMNLNPQDITGCAGCLSEEETIFFLCRDCKIRKCAKEKHFVSCAYCSEYACSSLNELFALDPGARRRLDEIRQKGRSHVT